MPWTGSFAVPEKSSGKEMIRCIIMWNGNDRLACGKNKIDVWKG